MKAETPEHAAQRAEILKLVEHHGLGAYGAAIEAALRPGIGLRTRDATAADLAVGAMRVGGEPDLPAGEDWPEGEDGPLHFVMQVSMPAVAPFDLEGLLPADGLLQVFANSYAEDVRVMWRAPQETLARRATPAHARRPAFRACGVDVLPEWHLPPAGSDFLGDADALLALDSDAQDIYWDEVWIAWRERQRPGAAGSCGIHQMLGFATAERLEAQSMDECVLIGFDSDDRARMEWGDVHCVWVLMKADDLAQRRFDKVRAEM
jgi:hypothetical protein